MIPCPEGYRANVGLVVFNAAGRVLLCRRVRTPPPYNWQFPQGGIDPGEALEAAARRELTEETGIVTVSLLGRTESWITYDFPAELIAQGTRGWKAAEGNRGQAQVWFAFRFEGDESEIALEQHHQVEFDAWRWARLDEAVDLIVPFKKGAYEQVVRAFSQYAL